MAVSVFLDEESTFRNDVVRFERVVLTGPDLRDLRLNVGATSWPSY